MAKKESFNVQGTEISVLTHRQDDYISLTDMAKYKNYRIHTDAIKEQIIPKIANVLGCKYEGSFLLDNGDKI